MRRLVHALGLSLALLATAGPAAAAPDGLTEEARELFAWWDALGYPDVARLPFVRVYEGGWREDEVGARHAAATHAFLLAEDGAAFRVFGTDLSVARHTTAASPTAPHRRVGFEPADLISFARAGLAAMRRVSGPVQWHDDKSLDPFELHRWADPNQAWRLLVLARAVAAREQPALALDLLALARREAADAGQEVTLAQLRRALVAEARVQLVQGLADPETSLAELSATAQRLLQATSADERPAELAEDAAILLGMLAAERETPTLAEAGPPTTGEMVRRLRGERGVRWDAYEGSPLPTDQAPDAPQRVLAARGLESVPVLLAALAERSFTRSVWVWETRHGQLRWHVEPYRVGDAALDTLREIAAGGFEPGWEDFHRLRSWKPGDREFVREAVEAWWQDVQARGEVAVLAERVARADDHAVWPAQRLAQIAPPQARTALRAAIEAADRPHRKAAFVAALASLAGDDVTQDLLALLHGGGPPRLGLAVARALTERGRREGLARMLREWRAPTPPERAPESPDDLDLPLDPSFRYDLLSYLLGTQDAEVLTTLAADLPGLDAHTRFQIVAHFLRDPQAGPAAGGEAARPARPLTQEARRALEDLLGASLSDEGEAGGTYMTVGDVEVEPRVGQAAAWALAQHFPDDYRFDPTLPRRRREEQRLAAENVWRQRRGKAPKPSPPARPQPAPVPDEVVGPVLDALLAATEDSRRELAERELEVLGLGALPAVTARLERLAADDAARATLLRAAARLASIVTEVRLEPEALVSKGWREQGEALRGQAFSGHAFAALVLHATRSGGPEVEGLHLGVERHDDGTGTQVVIHLLPAAGDPRPPDGWETSGPSLWVGERRPGGSSGSSAYDHGQSEAAWKDEVAEVDAAFGAAPEHRVRLAFWIRASR